MAPTLIEPGTLKEVPVDLPELALSTVGITDPAEVRRISDARYALRRARIMADPRLSDAMKQWYLERTIWENDDAAAEFDWNPGTIRKLRHATERLTGWSSSAYPDLDARQPHIGVEAGRLREWAEQRGSHDVNPADGKLIKRPGGPRHGRARANRGDRNKPGYELGSERVEKKHVPFGPRRKYTEEHIARLRELAGQGRTDEQIAAEIGEPFTDADKVQRLRQKHRIRRS